MKSLMRASVSQVSEWDAQYRRGTPPWDTGRPAHELVRLVKEGLLRPSPVLELGCGSGADAVFLASRGFDVTAVDSSPTAIERARTRAECAGVLVRFVLEDVFTFVQTAHEPFDVIYEAGFYHFMRLENLDRYLDLLWRVTRPGTLYLTLAGSVGEQSEGGPPQVSEDEIRRELGRLFELVELRPFRFESPRRREGYLGWSCLMRRPKPCSPTSQSQRGVR
jgi:methyl halide transferase